MGHLLPWKQNCLENITTLTKIAFTVSLRNFTHNICTNSDLDFYTIYFIKNLKSSFTKLVCPNLDDGQGKLIGKCLCRLSAAMGGWPNWCPETHLLSSSIRLVSTWIVKRKNSHNWTECLVSWHNFDLSKPRNWQHQKLCDSSNNNWQFFPFTALASFLELLRKLFFFTQKLY